MGGLTSRSHKIQIPGKIDSKFAGPISQIRLGVKFPTMQTPYNDADINNLPTDRWKEAPPWNISTYVQHLAAHGS